MKKTMPYKIKLYRYSTFILLIITGIFLSGCRLSGLLHRNEEKNSGTISGGAQNNGKIHIILYFPDNTQSYLIPEDRIAKFDTSLEKTIVNELIKGPYAGLKSPIPGGTRLLKVSREGDIVTVNLSEEFKKNHPGGSTGELMSIYSIVNSLTEIPGINSVLFKIEGRLQDTLAGHMTFNKPISRNRAILNKNTGLDPAGVLKLQMDLESSGKWLDAYVLLSDDPKNPDRKNFNDYIAEMEEVRALGFTEQEYKVGEFTLDESGTRAKVRVDFYTKDPGGSGKTTNTLYFNTVKIDGAWMVDWSTTQG